MKTFINSTLALLVLLTLTACNEKPSPQNVPKALRLSVVTNQPPAFESLVAAMRAAAAPIVTSNRPTSAPLGWDHSPDPAVRYYRIYWGAATMDYSNSVNAGYTNRYTITNLIPATTYYFVATSVNAQGQESIPTPELAYTTGTAGGLLPVTNYIFPYLEVSTNMLTWKGYMTGMLVNPPGQAAYFRSGIYSTNTEALLWLSPGGFPSVTNITR